MKVTEKMIDTVMLSSIPGVQWRSDVRAVLETALRDVPEVEPFRFAGYPNQVTVLHPTCGTVEAYDPAMTGEGSMAQAIAEGLCDCENTGPWLRVYVEKQEER